MSVNTLRTNVRRLAQAVLPRGEIVVVTLHACQSEAAAEARGQAALGRPWRVGDMCVLIVHEGTCARRRHTHEDPIIISPRND